MSQLAVGFKVTNDSGRERTTDGRQTNRGLIEANGFRAGSLGQSAVAVQPISGRGLEIGYHRDSGAGAPLGFLACYNRDTAQYEDLALQGKNVSIQTFNGGALSLPNGSITTPMLAANAAQQQIGSYLAAPGGAIGPSASWQATVLSTGPVSCGGGPLRIEASINASHNTLSASWYTGIGWDGNVGYSMSLVACPGANYPQQVGWIFYVAGLSGTHTFTVFIFNQTGTLTLASAVYSALYVTEQKR